MCRVFAFRVFHNILYTVMVTDITSNEEGKREKNLFLKKKIENKSDVEVVSFR